MPLHRFYSAELARPLISLDAEQSRHASRVLRLTAGTQVDLFDGAGCTASGTIVQIARAEVTVAVADVAVHPPRSGPALELVTALPRAHRQQFLFEKAAELGVAAIHPLICSRSTVKPAADTVDKWRRWCLEAAKQCGALYLTRVSAPLPFVKSLDLLPEGPRWIASPAAGATPLNAAIAATGGASRIAAWVGPEGGFDLDELRLADQAGLLPISLGRQILRIETAGLAIASCLAMADAPTGNPAESAS